MPIVNGASNIAPRARGGAGYADPQALSGIRRCARGTVAAIATDETGSRYFLTDVPSDAYLEVGTLFRGDGWAFAQLNIGTETNPTALGTVARASAASYAPIVANDARRWQEAWQALGLTANPGGRIGIWVHATANATAAGTLQFNIEYLDRV